MLFLKDFLYYSMAIPKIIHQTYRSKELPDDVLLNIEKLRRLNPGWDYRFYDDDAVIDFIRREFNSEILRVYEKINPAYGAARADFFRYLLMFRVGGVYLDIKSTATQAFDQVLMPDEEYVLCHWPNRPGESHEGWGFHHVEEGNLFPAKGEFQNWHIVARPQHPFLHHVIGLVMHQINRYSVAEFGVGQPGVLVTTGPISYTVAIHKIAGQYPHRVLPSHRDIGLEYSIYEGDGLVVHREKLGSHYSSLQAPVVL